jgi:hypothetical protein
MGYGKRKAALDWRECTRRTDSGRGCKYDIRSPWHGEEIFSEAAHSASNVFIVKFIAAAEQNAL